MGRFDSRYFLNVGGVALISLIAIPAAVVVSSILSAYWLERVAVCAATRRPLDYKHPFFVQERVGSNGTTFDCFKFRTMRDLGSDGRRVTVAGDQIGPRTIKYFGPLIRKSGADELPQLINVLRGEMAITGGLRPKTLREYFLAAGLPLEDAASATERFQGYAREGKAVQAIRELAAEGKLDSMWAGKISRVLEARPSIIGPTQVMPGDRVPKTPGDVRATRTMIQLQLNYMHKHNLRTDMAIFLAAFWKVARLAGDNVRPERGLRLLRNIKNRL